jgi:hypothetical protein
VQIYVLKFSRINSALDQPATFFRTLVALFAESKYITAGAWEREIFVIQHASLSFWLQLAQTAAQCYNFCPPAPPSPFNASIMINSLPQVMEIGVEKWKKKRGKV